MLTCFDNPFRHGGRHILNVAASGASGRNFESNELNLFFNKADEPIVCRLLLFFIIELFFKLDGGPERTNCVGCKNTLIIYI